MALSSQFAKLHRGLKAFPSARGGNVAITFALASILLTGMVGAGIDYGRANSAKSSLQAAADSAVLYAAKGAYSTESGRITAAIDRFNAVYPAKFGTASSTVKIANNSVALTATGQVPTTLLGVIGIMTIPVSASSVSQFGGTATACLLALQNSDDAIFIHGSATLNANCGLYSNSTSRNGINFDGDSVTAASSIYVVGNYVKDSSAKVTPTPQTNYPAMNDPLAALPTPSNAAASCTHNGYKLEGSGTLNPGVYCGGLEIGSSGKATFNPGNYIIRDGQFNIGSSAEVSGDGVFFYLTGSNAFLNQGSSSKMTFTAPTSGTYKGIVFFQSRTASTPANHFGGSSTDNIQGAVYFPNGTAEIACSGGVKADYTIWIVKRLKMDSSATLQINNNYAGSSTPLADSLSAMIYGKQTFLKQ